MPVKMDPGTVVFPSPINVSDLLPYVERIVVGVGIVTPQQTCSGDKRENENKQDNGEKFHGVVSRNTGPHGVPALFRLGQLQDG